MNDALRKLVIFILVAFGAYFLAFGLGRMVNGDGPGAEKEAPGAPAFSVDLLSDSPLPDGSQELRFSILDDDGEAVTAYDVKHEKELHLIVVERDDPRIYRHVHPTLADGVWSIGTDLGPGAYRLFADTTPTGAEAQVLSADFEVAGMRPETGPLPQPGGTSVRVDGYDVELAADGAAYTFTVTRAGKPVALETYLGAGGHLVGIREESLDYLHAHAEQAEGNTVAFHVEAQNAGTYVLHLDFQVDGTVRTATFVQRLEPSGPGSGMGEHEGHDMDDMEMEGHDGH